MTEAACNGARDVFVVMQGGRLTVSPVQPSGPVDAWPPSACWPDGAWARVPLDRLDAFLSCTAAARAVQQ